MGKNRENSKGFTLVETAIVLVIGGLILTMLFNSMNIYMKNTKLKTTRERIAAIDEQVQIYLEDRGFLPCPASLSAEPDTTSATTPYGGETNCSNAAIANHTFGTTVRIGMVPTRTLNLPDEFGYDAWGNRLLYAVTTNLARDATSYSRTGGTVNVVDSRRNSPANIITANAHYVVVSHGPDKVGGYNAGGRQGIACPPNSATAPLDQENCNNDGVFRNTVLVSDSGNASNFDDVVTVRAETNFNRAIPPGAVMLFNLPACPQGWVNNNSVPAAPPANHLYCRKTS
jgi:prepilin-type N-terminal cleavage/methylation domain-containing protein